MSKPQHQQRQHRQRQRQRTRQRTGRPAHHTQSTRPQLQQSGSTPVEYDEDGDPIIDWEDEKANHRHEYVDLPEGIEEIRAEMAKRAAEIIRRMTPDDYPPDWIERSNRLAAQDGDD